MIAFFEGMDIPGDIKDDLIAFTRPPGIISSRPLTSPLEKPHPDLPPDGFKAMYRVGGFSFIGREQIGGSDDTGSPAGRKAVNTIDSTR